MRKYAKAVVNLAIAVLILLGVIFLAPKVIVFFMPFVIGWIIAMIASPVVRFFEEKLKFKRKAGSAFVIIVVIGLVVLLLYLIGAKVVEELISFVESLPDMWASVELEFQNIAQNMSGVYSKLPKDVQGTWDSVVAKVSVFAEDFAGDILGRISTPTITAVGNFAKQLPTIIIGLIMCLLSAYFFVAERKDLTEKWNRVLPEAFQYRVNMVKRSLGKAVGGYLKAQVKIEVWIYLLLVIGFLILRVDYALLIAFGVAILDFLPFFGTGTVMLPWAIVKFLSADYPMTIGLLLIWGISQLVRQLIQPKIVGDSVGVPPLPTLFLLYIGYMVAGVIGMIVAVPVGLILYTMYEEGVFETTKNSVQILLAGINHFRRLTPQDKSVIETYKRECQSDWEEKQEQEERGKNEKL